MKTIILIIFLISTKIIYGQEGSDAKVKWYNKDISLTNWLIPKDEIESKLCLKIAPLSFLDIYSGMSVRVGIEYKLKNNYSLYNELGTFIPNPNSMNNNRGAIIKCEVKRYLNYDGLISGGYLSAGLFYKYQTYGTYDSIRSTPDYSKDYQVSKNVGCFTIKYGFMQVCNYRLIIDGFIGLGVRYSVITSTLTKDENNNIISSDDSYNINLLVNQAGNYIRPNIDIGFKIGYRIK